MRRSGKVIQGSKLKLLLQGQVDQLRWPFVFLWVRFTSHCPVVCVVHAYLAARSKGFARPPTCDRMMGWPTHQTCLLNGISGYRALFLPVWSWLFAVLRWLRSLNDTFEDNEAAQRSLPRSQCTSPGRYSTLVAEGGGWVALLRK